MGRNKYSQGEIDQIRKLLKMKCSANRFKQKAIRHELRTEYEFNISDFGEQGKAFGPEELDAALQRRAIVILDDATIADMKARRAELKAKLEAERAAENAGEAAEGETTDWQQALKEWEDYYNDLPQ